MARNSRVLKQPPSNLNTENFVYLEEYRSQFQIYLLLERLYQSEGTYTLVFSSQILRQIEFFFDQIIAQFGYRTQVGFNYQFNDLPAEKFEFP
jgi:hypothetical protein